MFKFAKFKMVDPNLGGIRKNKLQKLRTKE